MATAREIRRRIRSVKNVAQITRALQLVASSKVRRAQDRVEAARPYADQLRKVLTRLANAGAVDDDANPFFNTDQEDPDLRLIQKRETIKKVGIVLVTPDRGLAGAISSNTNRRALQLANDLRREHGANLPVQFLAVGRRGRDFLARNRLPLLAEFTALGDVPNIATVRAVARVVSDAYLAGDIDAWYLVYPRFISTLTQTPTSIPLLPVEPPEAEEEEVGTPIDYIYEPNAAAIYSALLPRYLETTIYQPILESVASFYAAQFVAMKNATDNATDLVSDLTLTYNKARQASITNQILEVVAGANASA